MERLVMNPGDFARLREAWRNDMYQGLSIPSTLMGFPVTTSEGVRPGQILRVKPQPLEPVAFKGFDPAGDAPDRTVWFRYGFDLMPQRQMSIVSTFCEGWPIKRLTAAQRRRKAKRFIREEVARRLMERRRR